MILAIETSSPQASIAVWNPVGENTIWSQTFVTDRRHNSVIFEHIEQALEAADGGLDRIAIGKGPGSYSGVRVGIATANGIAIALGIPVVGVSSLLAYSTDPQRYYVAGDARRNTYFLTEVGGEVAAEPELLPRDEFEGQIGKVEGPVFSMDESVVEQFEQIKLGYPSAEMIALKAIAIDPLKQAPIEPHYLRPPYITKAKKKPVPGFPEKK